MVWSGTAANQFGSFLFLGVGKKNMCRSLSDYNLVHKYGAPIGSNFWINDSGFMTIHDWIIATEQLCIALRSLPVVCDHTDWWFALTFDGFKAHEEIDSSHVNQSYDQQVAKCDKLETRNLLDM
eukprot:12333322-Ditylum_brightwellii.AAC.1